MFIFASQCKLFKPQVPYISGKEWCWPTWLYLLVKLIVIVIDNRPSTDKLHHFVRKKQKKTQKQHDMKCDTWHVTCDMWHVTKFQLPSSYCLWFMILWRLGRKGGRTELTNYELINHEATLGLLIIVSLLIK